ncbi:MAG: hypothetical protein ACKO7W_24065 [Elainella sp.]
MGFVTALLMTVGATFLYEKTQLRSVEVAVGCLALALLGLVVTLILAPWPIQLLLLLGILGSSLGGRDIWS